MFALITILFVPLSSADPVDRSDCAGISNPNNSDYEVYWDWGAYGDGYDIWYHFNCVTHTTPAWCSYVSSDLCVEGEAILGAGGPNVDFEQTMSMNYCDGDLETASSFPYGYHYGPDQECVVNFKIEYVWPNGALWEGELDEAASITRNPLWFCEQAGSDPRYCSLVGIPSATYDIDKYIPANWTYADMRGPDPNDPQQTIMGDWECYDH